MMNPLLIDASRNILETSLGLSPDETLLVVSDRQKQDIAEAIHQAGLGLGAEAMLVVMKERRKAPESRRCRESPLTCLRKGRSPQTTDR